MTSFRPWGNLAWLLPKLSAPNWSIIAAISPGERSLSCWRLLQSQQKLRETRLLAISDCDLRFQSETEARLELRSNEFTQEGGDHNQIITSQLFDHYDIISDNLLSFLSVAGPNIVVDLTALPKRYFFPMLRDVIRDGRVQNLIATYTVPKRYTPRSLAENFDAWNPLPTFRELNRNWQPQMMIVNVGFLAMSLPEHITPEETGDELKLLLPFPTPPPDASRNWQVLEKLQAQSQPTCRVEIIPVHSRDVSDAYDRLAILGERGGKRTILAPYGPKPISLAMCLYATQFKQPVYYTQPRAYHPDYSMGVSVVAGLPEVYGYCIKLNGRCLYGT